MLTCELPSPALAAPSVCVANLCFLTPQQVHLCGSFTRWVETVPMAAVEGSPGVYSVVVHLPPGCALALQRDFALRLVANELLRPAA